MKQKFTSIALLFTIYCHAQNFTAGNLVVSRVGDGAAALSASTAPVTLLEFDKITSGQTSAVKTVSVGSTMPGNRLTLGGNVSQEGQLNLSANNLYLSLLGYDVPTAEVNTNTGISSIAITTGGTGYSFSSVITISGGGGTGATAVVNSHTGGVITGIRITNSGSGYTSIPTVSITLGTGFTAGTINRVPYWQGMTSKKQIIRLDNTGAIDFTTNFSNVYNAAGPAKNAVTVDGSKYWINTARVEFLNFGQTTPPTQILNTASPRSIAIFNNQMFYLLGFVNAGLNITTPALPEVLAGTAITPAPINLTTLLSPIGFVLFDLSTSISYNSTGFDLLYIADANGGLEKYYFDGTNWLPLNSKNAPAVSPLNNHIFPGASVSAITGELNSSGQPVIYAVGGNGTASNNSLYAITDASGRTGTMALGTNTTSVTLATAGANYSFKGISFTPGSNPIVLPVKLVAFSASLINSKTALRWQTAFEIDAKEIVVERSKDGSTFNAIGTVPAKNANRLTDYAFEDALPVNGINFYRLKFIDQDGRFEYSRMVSINLNYKNLAQLSIFPNPVVSILNITHEKASSSATIKVVNVAGQTITQFKVAEKAVQTSFDLGELRTGQYFIIYVNNGRSTSTAFIK